MRSFIRRKHKDTIIAIGGFIAACVCVVGSAINHDPFGVLGSSVAVFVVGYELFHHLERW